MHRPVGSLQFLLQFPQIFQHVPTTLQEEPPEDGKHSQAVHRGAKESYTGAPNAI